MRNRSCPRCHSAGSYLREESRIAQLDYYHCDHCGEFWLVDPMNPTKPERTAPPSFREPARVKRTRSRDFLASPESTLRR